MNKITNEIWETPIDGRLAVCEKTCSKCKQVLAVACFNVDKRGRFGLDNHCKVCRKEWRTANKERHVANARRWQAENPERHKYHQKCYAARKKLRRELVRIYGDAHTEFYIDEA